MKLIDLKDYAHFSKKIPTTFLDKSQKVNLDASTGKVLLSHLVDFYVVASAYFLLKELSDLTLYRYLISPSLRHAFERTQTPLFNIALMATLFGGYFFFCYFFNHGQTLGMFHAKTRIRMKHKSFKAAFGWTFYSFCVLTSGGIIAAKGKQWLKEDGWGAFEVHDHLYLDLMTDKEWSPVNLVSMTEKEKIEGDIILDQAA